MLALPTAPPDAVSPEFHPERPTMVLLNPRAAGGQAAALAQPVREWLATHAPGVALVESDSIERSRATLQCMPRSSRVVLIGGDGTLHHMLPVLLTHRLGLGVVPLGGGNDTARALGVAGMAWPQALELALRGPTRRMDVGELITPRLRVPFFSSLAAGFDAAVAMRALDGPRWLDGLPRYLWATVAELASLRTHRIRIALDGEPRYDGEAIFASALNTRSYGSGMPAVPGARVGDGKLDLLLAGPFGRVGALTTCTAAARTRTSKRRSGSTGSPSAASGSSRSLSNCMDWKAQVWILACGRCVPLSRRGSMVSAPTRPKGPASSRSSLPSPTRAPGTAGMPLP